MKFEKKIKMIQNKININWKNEDKIKKIKNHIGWNWKKL
jgi:hypothetical protein